MRTSSIVVLTAALFAAAGTANADLIRNYGLNETTGTTAVDSTGTANGTYVGSPTLGVASAYSPLWDTAVSFNGSQYVDIGSSLGSYSIDGGFTIAAWVNASSRTTWQPIAGKSAWSAGGWMLMTNGSSELSLVNPTVGECKSSVAALTSADLGKWVHLAATYDGTNSHFYKNGVELTNAGWGIGMDFGTTTDSYRVGTTDNPADGFVGALDEVRIYNSALSQGAIAQLAEIPEPSSIAIMVTGLIGLLAYAWRKRK